MRGVFLISFLLLSVTFCAQALELSGAVRGQLGLQGWEHELGLKWELKRSPFDLSWGTSVKAAGGVLEAEPWWQLCAPLGEGFSLGWSGNRPHYTSGDLFRLIHKDNFEKHSRSLLAVTDQIRLGLLSSIPLRTGNLGEVCFCEHILSAGPFAVRGLHLGYEQAQGGGSAHVLQGEAELKGWNAAAGWGSRRDFQGIRAQAEVLEISRKGSLWQGSFSWQRVEPDFLSLAAGSNKCTPDRRGWLLELGLNFPELELFFKRRLQHNLEKTRSYNQLSWGFAAPDRIFSLERRLEPTEALIMRLEGENSLFQLDLINGTARFDWQPRNISYGLRFDGPRQISRLELNFELGGAWRAIAKYDRLTKRLHSSLLLRHKSGSRTLWLEAGHYDRGNMLAGFNNPRRFCISWQWEF